MARRQDAGVVDEDVEAAEFLDGPPDHVPGLGRVADIGRDADRPAAQRDDLGGDGGRSGPIDVRGRDEDALARQPEGDAPADPHRGTRDEGDLCLKAISRHHRVSSASLVLAGSRRCAPSLVSAFGRSGRSTR